MLTSITFDTPIAESYLRNNRSTRQKSLRCFPTCSAKGHVSGGFCGVPLKVSLELTTSDNIDEFLFAAEIRTLKEPKLSGSKYVLKDQVFSQIRTRFEKSTTENGELFVGVVTDLHSANGVYKMQLEFNTQHCSWDYAWKSNRWSGPMEQHVVDIMAIRANTNDNDMYCEITDSAVSSSFIILSSHKKPTKPNGAGTMCEPTSNSSSNVRRQSTKRDRNTNDIKRREDIRGFPGKKAATQRMERERLAAATQMAQEHYLTLQQNNPAAVSIGHRGSSSSSHLNNGFTCSSMPPPAAQAAATVVREGGYVNDKDDDDDDHAADDEYDEYAEASPRKARGRERKERKSSTGGNVTAAGVEADEDDDDDNADCVSDGSPHYGFDNNFDYGSAVLTGSHTYASGGGGHSRRTIGSVGRPTALQHSRGGGGGVDAESLNEGALALIQLSDLDSLSRASRDSRESHKTLDTSGSKHSSMARKKQNRLASPRMPMLNTNNNNSSGHHPNHQYQQQQQQRRGIAGTSNSWTTSGVPEFHVQPSLMPQPPLLQIPPLPPFPHAIAAAPAPAASLPLGLPGTSTGNVGGIGAGMGLTTPQTVLDMSQAQIQAQIYAQAQILANQQVQLYLSQLNPYSNAATAAAGVPAVGQVGGDAIAPGVNSSAATANNNNNSIGAGNTATASTTKAAMTAAIMANKNNNNSYLMPPPAVLPTATTTMLNSYNMQPPGGHAFTFGMQRVEAAPTSATLHEPTTMTSMLAGGGSDGAPTATTAAMRNHNSSDSSNCVSADQMSAFMDSEEFTKAAAVAAARSYLKKNNNDPYKAMSAAAATLAETMQKSYDGGGGGGVDAGASAGGGMTKEELTAWMHAMLADSGSKNSSNHHDNGNGSNSNTSERPSVSSLAAALAARLPATGEAAAALCADIPVATLLGPAFSGGGGGT